MLLLLFFIIIKLHSTSTRTAANGFYGTHNNYYFFEQFVIVPTSYYAHFMIVHKTLPISARVTRIATQNNNDNNNNNIRREPRTRDVCVCVCVLLRRFISYINRRFSTSTRGARTTYPRKTYAPLRGTSCVYILYMCEEIAIRIPMNIVYE